MRLAVVYPWSRDGLPEGERQQRYDRLLATVSPGTEVSFYHVERINVFSASHTSSHIAGVGADAAQQIERAAAEGADVVLVSGGIEPGVALARGRVSVPVVGTAQAVYAVAAQLGARLGIIVYVAASIEDNWAVARSHHADHLIASIREIGIPGPELYPRREEVRRRVVEVARELLEQDGATAIYPIGLSMVPASISAEEVASQVGAPVLDGERITVRTAELIGELRLPARR